MRKHPFIFLLVIAITFTSCKKWQKQYPEDTEKTKLTPTERLVGKWWTLQSTFLNDKDYTDTVYQTLGKYQILFSKNLYETTIQGLDSYYGSIKTDLELPFTTIWTLSSDESSIAITPLNGNNSSKYSFVPGYTGPPPSGLNYTIIKLTNSELKISLKWSGSYTIITDFISN